MPKNNTNDSVKTLIEKYHKQDNCAAEFLACERVPVGMSFEAAFETYIAVMKTVEKDSFFVRKENETIEL